MDIADFIVSITGKTVAELFSGADPLVRIENLDGVLSVAVWDTSLGVPPPSSEALAAAKIALPPRPALTSYAAARRFALEVGGITVGGARIDTDRESQSMIANAYAYVQASGVSSVKYKAASGWVSMSSDQIKATALAVGAWVQNLFSKEEEIDGGISSGNITTLAQIDAAFASVGVGGETG